MADLLTPSCFASQRRMRRPSPTWIILPRSRLITVSRHPLGRSYCHPASACLIQLFWHSRWTTLYGMLEKILRISPGRGMYTNLHRLQTNGQYDTSRPPPATIFDTGSTGSYPCFWPPLGIQAPALAPALPCQSRDRLFVARDYVRYDVADAGKGRCRRLVQCV